MAEFLTPCAADNTGAMVLREKALRGSTYRCFDCGAPLTVREGRSVRKHFAHIGNRPCSGNGSAALAAMAAAETALHKAAKACIVRVVSEWLAGGRRPTIERTCPTCKAVIRQGLPERVTRAEEEVRIPTGSPVRGARVAPTRPEDRVLDVALFAGDDVCAAVEILVTHAVDEVKATALPIPWLELHGAEVCEDPWTWRAVQDGLKPFTCSTLACQRLRLVSVLTAAVGRAESLRRRDQHQWPAWLPPLYSNATQRQIQAREDTIAYMAKWEAPEEHRRELNDADLAVEEAEAAILRFDAALRCR